VIYWSTGSAADIKPTIEQFRTAISLGGVNNGDQPAVDVIGRREINWDGQNIMFSGPWLTIESRGVLFWNNPLISLEPDSENDPLRGFGNINPTYPGIFKPYSGDQLAAGTIYLRFMLAGKPYYEAGIFSFGAVFTDVDIYGNASLTFMDRRRNEYEFGVPAAPGDGNLSFLGVVFDPEDELVLVGIKAGNVWPSATAFDGETLSDGRIADIVGFDDLIYSEPHLLPEPEPFWSLTVAGMLWQVLVKRRMWTFRIERILRKRPCAKEDVTCC
jgi:hypothetical protein